MSRSAALLLLVLASGCPGAMTLRDQSGAADRGGEAGRRSDAPKADAPRKVDLPVTPGAPCLSGACGPNLICMANECLKMCTEAPAGCNAKVATCGALEACLFASSFTGACYPAPRAVGQTCDDQQAIFCAQGNLCVKVGAAAPICLQLCQYGCPASTTCGKTNTGCSVCVPN